MFDMYGEKVFICGFKLLFLYNFCVEFVILFDNENDNQIVWLLYVFIIVKVFSVVFYVDLKDIKIWNFIYYLGFDFIIVIKVFVFFK